MGSAIANGVLNNWYREKCIALFGSLGSQALVEAHIFYVGVCRCSELPLDKTLDLLPCRSSVCQQLIGRSFLSRYNDACPWNSIAGGLLAAFGHKETKVGVG